MNPVSGAALIPISGVTAPSALGTNSLTLQGSAAQTVSNESLQADATGSNVLGASDSLGNSGTNSSNVDVGSDIIEAGGIITYDLGAKFDVTNLLVWNFSQFGSAAPGQFSQIGANSVDIFSSTTGLAGSYTSDGTVNFAVTPLADITGNPGANDIPAQIIGVTIPDAQYIELQLISNQGYSGLEPDGKEVVGLNEVNFVGTPAVVPEPSTCALMLGGLVLLGLCLRRKSTFFQA